MQSTIFYRPDGEDLPKDTFVFELAVAQFGTKRACEDVEKILLNGMDVACRTFLPIGIASHLIQKGVIDSKSVLVVERHETRDYTVLFDEEGELRDNLFNQDNYLFEYLWGNRLGETE